MPCLVYPVEENLCRILLAVYEHGKCKKVYYDNAAEQMSNDVYSLKTSSLTLETAEELHYVL